MLLYLPADRGREGGFVAHHAAADEVRAKRINEGLQGRYDRGFMARNEQDGRLMTLLQQIGMKIFYAEVLGGGQK
jgi:hypothetical protein